MNPLYAIPGSVAGSAETEAIAAEPAAAPRTVVVPRAVPDPGLAISGA